MSNDASRHSGTSTSPYSGGIRAVCARFEAAWRAGENPRIEAFLGEGSSTSQSERLRVLLIELVKIDLRCRWDVPVGETVSVRGSSESTGGSTRTVPSNPRLDDYCTQYPTLGDVAQLPLDLIVAEYQARHLGGDRPDKDEYRQRFPQHGDALVQALTAADAALAAEARRRARAADRGARSLPTVPREQFVDHLTASGLLSGDELSQFQESLSPEDRSSDGTTLALRLIQSEKITPYQAEQVCRGETRLLAFGEYVVLDRLGAGGMGQVLKARHRAMGRLVAIKVIAPKLVDSPDAVKRFQREVHAAAKLNHPNIVTAYDAGEHEGSHFLAMEYVDGHDLAQVVRRAGPLPVDVAVDYIVQAARGLEYAHEQGIVHRDIKPGNLLLDNRGTVKILDMGLARLDDAGDDDLEAEQLTGSSQMMGTSDYMAPEQALDTHGVDHRADIYSLGCTLYRLLTGERPYKGTTPLQVLMAHREAAIPSLVDAREDAPARLDAVFQKMVAKLPEDRYESMTEVIEALEACLGDDDRPSDSALTSFLHDVEAQQSGVGLLRGHDTSVGTQTEPGTPAPLPVRRTRRLKPLLAIGGPMLALVFLAVLATLLLPRDGSRPTHGTLVVEGPIEEVEIAARHASDEVYRRVELDAEGRVSLKPGPYRLGLVRGHKTHRLAPDRITVASGKQAVVKIEPKPEADRPSVAFGFPQQPQPIELGPPVKIEPKPITIEPDPEVWKDVEPGERMGLALLTEPAAVEGLRSWTLDTVGHRRAVTGVVYSPDGKWVASSSEDGTIRFWEPTAGRQTHVLHNPHGAVRSLAVSPDGRHVASGSDDGSVCFWSTSPPRLLRSVSCSTERIEAIAWSPEGTRLALACGDRGLVLLDAASGQSAGTFAGFQGPVHDVAYSPDGRQMAAGDDKAIYLFDAELHGTKTIPHESKICCIDISPDAHLLATGDEAGKVCLWDIAAGKRLHGEKRLEHGRSIVGNDSRVLDVAFSPDGQMLASSGVDNRVRIWSVWSGDSCRDERWLDYYHTWRGVAWSPRAAQLAVGSHFGDLRQLEAATLRPQWQAIGRHDVHLFTLAQSPDREFVAVRGSGWASESGTTDFVWCPSARTWERLGKAGILGRPVFSDSGQLRVWAGGKFNWLDLRTRELVPLQAPRLTPSQAWSPGGRLMAYPDEEEDVIVVVDVVKDVVLHRLKGYITTYMYMAFSADGRRLATMGKNYVIEIWNIVTGNHECTIESIGRPFFSFSPDGSKIASTYQNQRTANVFSRSGEPLKSLQALEDCFRGSPLWSEDGKTLYLREDSLVSVWNVETGECVRTIPYLQARESLDGLYLFPGGKVLATTGGSNMVYFWEPREPRLSATLMLLPEGRTVLFSPQGHWQGPEGVEKELVYVALTDAGEQITLTPEEFSKKYGWKNDPAKVTPLTDAGKPGE